METRMLPEVPYETLAKFVTRKEPRKTLAVVATEDMLAIQQAHWAKLHTLEQAPTREWIETWLGTIPGVCGCRSKIAPFLADHPIDNATTDLASCRVWAVDLHNFVNKKLGKPQFGLGDAWRRWAWLMLPRRKA